MNRYLTDLTWPTTFTLLLGLFGMALYVLGLFGWLSVVTAGAVGMIILLYFGLIIRSKSTFALPRRFSRLEMGLLLIFGLFTGVYSLGIGVPETGFDALWYHLPEAQVYAGTGKIQKIPELYYSTMPRLGDMYYAAAFLFGDIGLVKAVSMGFGWLYAGLAYLLSSNYFKRPQAILVALITYSMYVVAWQSSSAYVDLMRSAFELAGLLSLIAWQQKRTSPLLLTAGGVLFGLAMGVKMQAGLAFLAAAIFIWAVAKKKNFTFYQVAANILVFSLVGIIMALPWYLENYLGSGHPFYPVNLAGQRAEQLDFAGAGSTIDWLVRQILRWPALIYFLTYKGSGILTPALMILWPVFLLRLPYLWRRHKPLFLYAVIYTTGWWLMPPTESRYLLGALVPLLILFFMALTSLPRRFETVKLIGLAFLLAGIGLNFGFRLKASIKYVPVLTGKMSAEEYIESQTDDFNRAVVEKFYSGYWRDYRYPGLKSQ